MTTQQPQRDSASSGTQRPPSRASGASSDSSSSSRDRRYPGTALGLMLVAGVLLGLLLAAVISSLVDGGSSTTSTPTASSSSSPSPSRAQGAQSRERADQFRADQIRTDKAPEDRDVRILGCGTDGSGFASARVLITNSTSTRSTYYVRVVFVAAGDGRTISDDVASVKRLRPGESAPLQTVNAVDAAPGEQVLCQLGSVTRF